MDIKIGEKINYVFHSEDGIELKFRDGSSLDLDLYIDEAKEIVEQLELFIKENED